MRHCLSLFIAILSFHSVGQNKVIDRSNYQLLWEISRADMQGKAFLFGTYHSNDNDVFEFPDALYSALHEAEAVVLETDITEFMLDESTISPDVGYSKSYLLEWIVPARGADKVTYTAYGSDEGRPQFIDMYFKQVADNCSKAFHPLETIEDQLKIGLNNLLDPNAPKNIRLISRSELKQKYLEGNARDLHKYTRNSTLEFIDLYKDLIVDRNIKMTNGIDTLIHQYKSSFIAVGASHLLGSRGIVPLLRQKGYTVKVVKSEFTKKKSQAEIDLQQCNQYNYLDQRYGASLKFGGKPAVKELGNADRLIQYQELGQGNIYSLSIYNYGVEVNLTKNVRNYFLDPELSISRFDSLILEDNSKAYQGLVTLNDGTKEWVRVFKKKNVLYTLSAKGGYRFMNSNRHLNFFNGFKFSGDPTDESFSEKVISESQTMQLKFPKNYFSETRTLDFDNVWDTKWINPLNGEILYAYESIMTDNTISHTHEEFGDYILTRYHSDSVKIENERHVKGEYLLKSYTAQVNGYTVYGKIRQTGNVIQFIEYIGNDKIRKDEFLNSFDTLYSFPEINEEVEVKNEDFETLMTKDGFKMEVLDLDGKQFRETKNYTFTDAKTSIAYHVLVKKFHSWAFSQKKVKDLLTDQIVWPSEDLNYEIDTSFYLDAQNPFMEFSIYYPDSENKFKGKATLVGKNIVIANLTYPQKAEEQYKNLSFLDSLKFMVNDAISMHEINVPKLKNEIMINGGMAVEELIIEGHVGDSMLTQMLEWPAQFWNSFDEDGILLSSVVYAKDWENSDKKLLEYWRERTTSKNQFVTVSALYNLQKMRRAADYMTVVNEAKTNKINAIDFYKVLAITDPKDKFLEEVWPVFAELLEDSLSWNISFTIPTLLEKPFFQAYFTSEKFIKAITKDTQPPWAAFRYFEIMYEYGIPKEQFSKMLTEWNKNSNDHKVGSIAAWKTIIGEKTSGKVKRLVKKDAAVAISYAKVMAVSETPIYGLLSFEQMIGYIAFDHYKDAYFDKNKSLKFIENRIIRIDNKQIEFALFKVIENDKVYFMARALPENRILPSYGAFGNNTFFVYGSEEYQPKKIEEELVKKILE
ncbi:TraB/GumN family protein [Brumimicrobium glaciale]|uniref:TraB/GumN family protein n=1 Tax=Brumimicrobium glaciale TaxID=200475 RepID=A0A4V1WG91_9FLAO|nr:TraB/GumN family protein [Brumimicrobium glaciale]RYM35881.1 TraB/GumN family protein [Brumimicrobium glaciale]